MTFIWFGGLPYLQMLRWIGPFFIMIEVIVKEDVVTWACVLVLCLAPLSLSFSLLFQAQLEDSTDPDEQELMAMFVPWSEALYSQWLMMFGLVAPSRSVTQLSVVIVTIIFIVLLNLLAVNLVSAVPPLLCASGAAQSIRFPR